MKIGIDARLWNETGVGRYIRNVVSELARLDRVNNYVIFMTEGGFDQAADLPPNFKKVKTGIHWHTLAEQTLLPITYLKEHLDLLFVPHFNVPVFYPGKFIVTIHDLTVLRVRTGRVTTLPYPVYLIKYIGAFIAYLVAVRRSCKIFTVSQFVKNDITKTFKVSPSKIVLTPNAVDGRFFRRTDIEIEQVLKKYLICAPYLFYVGNAHPHKNLERLIKAFGIIASERPDLFLVLGGKKDFFYERLENESRNLAFFNRLKFVGFIDDTDLPALYSGAEVFVNPSMYEGFGIQILEAFACGCKVACSETTSLPEIGGKIANYFDPYDVQNMASIIGSTVTGKLKNPFPILRKYSWEESARIVYSTILTL